MEREFTPHQKLKKLQEGQQDVSQLKTLEKLREYKKFKGQELINLFNFQDFSKTFQNNTYTRKQLLNIIEQNIFDLQREKSLNIQTQNRQKAMEQGDIIKGAERLPENKRFELHYDGNLYEILQVAFSPESNYFLINPSKFIQGDKPHNRNIFIDAINHLVIDPSMLPEGGLQTLGIQKLDPDCQNFKEKFKNFEPLRFLARDEGEKDKTKHTYRIGFIDGVAVVFRTFKTAFQAGPNATAGEKKKFDISKYMNVYQDLYSLIRSQEYTLRTEENNVSDYQDIKDTLVQMLQDIQFETKHMDVKRQLDDMIDQIDKATNFQTMISKVYNLQHIKLRNRGTDAKHLEGAINKFTERVQEVSGILNAIQFQLKPLKDMLEIQEVNLETIHAKALMNVDYYGKKDKQFLFAFQEYQAKTKDQNLLQPFRSFDQQINLIFGTLTPKSKMDKRMILKAEVLFNLQRLILNSYQIENDLKLGLMRPEQVKKSFNLSEFEYIKSKYPDVYNAFLQDIEDQINSFSPSFSKQEIDDFFDTLRNPKSMEEKIIALRKL